VNWRRRLTLACGAVAAYLCVVVALITIGSHATLPDQDIGLAPNGGGVGAATHQLLGRGGTTDFLVDYASAHAMVHGRDAYAPGSETTEAVGTRWEVSHANPHPPTQLTLVMPFTVVHYEWAQAAWAVAMAVAFVVTIRAIVPSWRWSMTAGVAISLTFPGAYGIGNPVPIIGLGVAMAFWGRDRPFLGGLGLALAAGPKASGLALFVPFLLSGRRRLCVWAAAMIGVLSVVPLLFQRDVWSRYLDAGVSAIDANAARGDNASLLRLGEKWGFDRPITVVVLGLVTLFLILRTRDLYWPAAWATIAVLPILWMYSLLTFMPLFARVLHRRSRSAPLVLLASGLMLASPPLGMWPVWIAPTVVALAAFMLAIDGRVEDEFWLTPELARRVPLLADAPDQVRSGA
jgi:hypothetical protein